MTAIAANHSTFTPVPAMPVQRGHGIGHTLRSLAVTLLALGGTGAIYQALATSRDRRAYPAPGQMVDVDGHRLHLHVMGPPNDGPTVILETGLGMPAACWAWVQPAVSQFARVVAYDRAGLGWSEPGPTPRDGRQIARELHTALNRAAIPGPYVLVGHSLGGLFVRVFADLYPDEVAGLALIDATHPDQWDRSTLQRQGQTGLKVALQALGWLAWPGVTRWLDLSRQIAVGLPSQAMAEMRAFLALPSAWATTRAEFDATLALTRDEVRQAQPLGERPLAVVTAAKSVALDSVHGELQTELAQLSSRSRQWTVDGGDHASVVFSRAYAPQVVEAIRHVVEAVRMGQAMAQSPAERKSTCPA